MKKLLICIITVLSVAACSSDVAVVIRERPNPDVPSDEQTNQRMLYRMSKVQNDSDGKHTLTFQYDNQNRIIGFTDILVNYERWIKEFFRNKQKTIGGSLTTAA